jgi:hypothetical protein
MCCVQENIYSFAKIKVVIACLLNQRMAIAFTKNKLLCAFATRRTRYAERYAKALASRRPLGRKELIL